MGLANRSVQMHRLRPLRDALRAGRVGRQVHASMCPTGALQRKFIEDPYFQYTIDETLCNGCGKCVKGCNAFGNGSLFLQIHHDRCLNCNQCSIAAACPAQAFQRVPADHPYLLKSADHA
jgi:Fe-S-cluster-containing hydrogenase component 2